MTTCLTSSEWSPAVTRHWRPEFDCRDPSVLEYARSCCCCCSGKTEEVLHRIELGLVWELQRACGIERQRCSLKHLSVEADRPRCLSLAFDIAATAGVPAKGISVLGFEIA